MIVGSPGGFLFCVYAQKWSQIFVFTNFRPLQSAKVRELINKGIRCVYQIDNGWFLEEVKIVVIGKTSSQASVPQSENSWEETRILACLNICRENSDRVTVSTLWSSKKRRFFQHLIRWIVHTILTWSIEWTWVPINILGKETLWHRSWWIDKIRVCSSMINRY